MLGPPGEARPIVEATGCLSRNAASSGRDEVGRASSEGPGTLSYHSRVPTPDLVARFRAARSDRTLVVLEGFHAIKHAIRFGAAFESIVTSDVAVVAALAERLAPDVVAALIATTVEVPHDIFSSLSPTPPETGIIAVARRPGPAAPRPDAPIVLLESPAHSGNIGAVVRVAAAAGAAAVITTGSNDPWNPGALRGSAGLHYALPVRQGDVAQFADRELIAIDPDGAPLARGRIPDSAVLAFGSERSGLSPGLLDRAARRLALPMEPGVSSLNLATAVAATLYHWRLAR